MFAMGMSSSSSAGSSHMAVRRPRSVGVLRLSAIAAACLSKVTHAQISGACEDVTGEEVNPDCWTEIRYATEHIEEHRDRYPAGISSVADYQCALYLQGDIDPKTGASTGAANYGCTLPPCARLSPSMSSGDGNQAYNEVFSDTTPDFCTVDAMKKNKAEAEQNRNSAPNTPSPEQVEGDGTTPLPEERDGFEVGDYVKWVGADSEVPAGSIGIVDGFNDDGINVKFEDGEFNFLPSELTMVTPDEAEAYEEEQTRHFWTLWGTVLLVAGCCIAAASCVFYRVALSGKKKAAYRGARMMQSPPSSADASPRTDGESEDEDDSPAP